MQQPSEITVERVEKALIVIQEQDNIGLKTVNHCSLAMKGFVNWMVPSRMPRNPLQELELRNAETDVRHQRRALRPEEFTCLIKTARNSKRTIQHYDGETRSRIYLLSFLTGLRRAEIASLTPESFDLKTIPPTLVVEAATSKRRKKDVLPLHDVLVAMLKEWLADLAPNEPLFPKLANRRTWLMVKLDLKAAGIPYRTKDGVADFHAAGRHTYITELLRNGTSLVEARELARHADVKMTMNYTHIGLEDRAKAVQNLPTDPKWLQMRCISGVPEGHLQSSDDTGCHSDAAGSGDTSPCDVSPSGTHRQKKAPSVTDGAQWRRRESNPDVSSRKWRELQALVEREQEVAALALHSDGPDWHSLSPGTLELAELITCWPQLPEPIRQVILTIVRSVNVSQQAISDSAEPNRAQKRVIIP